MGTFTYENQGSNTFLVYTMGETEQIDTLTGGMTSDNRINGALIPGFVQSNMERRLKYNISSKITLEQYFSGSVKKRQLLGILESVTETLIMADGYLLSEENFLLDERYLYVDVGRRSGCLLAFPVERPASEGRSFYDFVRQMMFGLNFDEMEDCGYVAVLMNFLNRKERFSLQEFRDIIKQLARESDFAATGKSDSTTEEESGQKASLRKEADGVTAVSPGEAESSPLQKESGEPLPKQGFQIPSFRPKKEAVLPEIAAGSGEEKEEGTEKKSALRSLFGKKAAAEKNRNSFKRGLAFQIPGMTGVTSSASVEKEAEDPERQESQKKPKPFYEEQMRRNQEQPGQNREQPDFGSTVIMGQEEDNVTVIVGQGLEQEEGERLVALTRVKNGQTMVMEQDILRIGSSSGYVDFYIGDNRTVSRTHADILMQDQRVFIRDNNSRNHTYVNGTLVPAGELVPLSDNDRIRLSDEEFVIAVKIR